MRICGLSKIGTIYRKWQQKPIVKLEDVTAKKFQRDQYDLRIIGNQSWRPFIGSGNGKLIFKVVDINMGQQIHTNGYIHD